MVNEILLGNNDPMQKMFSESITQRNEKSNPCVNNCQYKHFLLKNLAERI